MATKQKSSAPRFPKARVDALSAPLQRYFSTEASSGLVLLAAALAALMIANSALGPAFEDFWATPIGFSFGGAEWTHALRHWINDGLVTIFFFVVGLEIKRELTSGELSTPGALNLPLAAALGGMAAPALIYLALAQGPGAAKGWGVVMATDIAFVVGCLALLGDRIPRSLRAFMLSLAIIDDIGAILVIAIGYSQGFNAGAFALALCGLALVALLRWLGVRPVIFYWMAGIATWAALHESGVHPTIAGVALGLMTPAKPWLDDGALERFMDWARGADRPSAAPAALARAAKESISPLQRLEHELHPWSAYLVLPLFALANAGVPLGALESVGPIALATFAGLAFGKPIGVFLLGWLAVKLNLARKPDDMSWPIVLGGGMLAGIGFTMALFIAQIAFADAALHQAKLGVLIASLAAGAAGMALLYWLTRPRSSPTA